MTCDHEFEENGLRDERTEGRKQNRVGEEMAEGIWTGG